MRLLQNVHYATVVSLMYMREGFGGEGWLNIICSVPKSNVLALFVRLFKAWVALALSLPRDEVLVT